MNRTIVSAFVTIAGGKVLAMLVMFLTIPIIVRLLGADGFGMYATLMSIFALLMIFVSSGVNSGVRKYLSEERETTNWKDNVFGYYFRLATVFSVIAAIFLLLAAKFGVIEWGLDERFAPYLYLLAILAIIAQFRHYLRRSLMGLKLEHISEPIDVGHKIVFGVTSISFILLGFGVAGVLMGHIVASLMAATVSIYFIAKHLRISHIVRPTPSDFPRAQLLSFNHFAILYVFLLTSLFHIDILMLEYFTTSAQVGYYKAALVIAEFLWFVPHSVGLVMIQSTANLWYQGEIDRINSLASKVTRYTLIISILLALGLAVLAPTFVPIYYGPDFTPSILLILLLLPGTIGYAFARPIMTISFAKGDMKILLLSTGASAVLNFLLNLMLIPNFGMEGAAVATSIGYGSLPIFHIWAAYTMGYKPLGDIRIVRIALSTVLAGGVILGVSMAISSPILSLVIVPPVGFVVFSVLILVTGAVTMNELIDIISQLPQPIDRSAIVIQRKFEWVFRHL